MLRWPCSIELGELIMWAVHRKWPGYLRYVPDARVELELRVHTQLYLCCACAIMHTLAL